MTIETLNIYLISLLVIFALALICQYIRINKTFFTKLSNILCVIGTSILIIGVITSTYLLLTNIGKL